MVVVSVDDVGVPREILGPIRNNDALITQNLGATPNQRCKDSNLVAATPEAQCEIDCHHLGTGTPPQGTVCYKHEHLKPFWYIGRPYFAEFHSKARPLQNCKRLPFQAPKPSIKSDRIDENCPYTGPIYAEKRLALWRTADIK
jgi:hypothetical protein